jgi:hypothetical protein
MTGNDKHVLEKFAQVVLELDIDINSLFRTKNYDYEIVTYFDEVQILDSDDTIVVSVKKDGKEREKS